MNNTTEEIYIRQSSKTTYDVEKVMEIIGLEDALRFKCIRLKDNLVKKYFEQHPKLKRQYEELMLNDKVLWNDKEFNKPFLASRKKRGDK